MTGLASIPSGPITRLVIGRPNQFATEADARRIVSITSDKDCVAGLAWIGEKRRAEATRTAATCQSDKQQIITRANRQCEPIQTAPSGGMLPSTMSCSLIERLSGGIGHGHGGSGVDVALSTRAIVAVPAKETPGCARDAASQTSRTSPARLV